MLALLCRSEAKTPRSVISFSHGDGIPNAPVLCLSEVAHTQSDNLHNRGCTNILTVDSVVHKSVKIFFVTHVIISSNLPKVEGNVCNKRQS